MKNSSGLKKIAVLLGTLVGLAVVAALVIPFVVDVDKYRPKIVEAANQKINGKLELGKMALNLWGHVQVRIAGLKVSDASGRPLLEVRDAAVNIPLLSVISGHPELRLVLDSPQIAVLKQKDGKLNAMTLMKPESPAAGATGGGAPQANPSGATGGSPAQIPAMVLNSRITVLINHAGLAYRDEGTGDQIKVDDLNFSLKDVSPSGVMPFQLTANLNVQMKQGAKIIGPLVFSGSAQAFSSSGAFEKAELKALFKLDDVEIVSPGVFDKKPGVALGFNAEGTVSKDQFAFPTLKFRLADVTVDAAASGKTVGEATSIDFKAQTNQIDIAKLGGLSPLIKEYGMNGTLDLAVNASGPTQKLEYGANLKFNKITLTNEALKQPIEVNGSLAVLTNQVKELLVSMTAKNFDLKLDGSLQNFLAPRFKFTLVSNDMDLDGLLKSSEKAAEARKEHAAASNSTGSGKATGPAASQATVVDYDAMFKPLRENPLAAAAAGTFGFSLKHVRSTGVPIDDIKGELALNNLLLTLKDFSLRIFDGTVKGAMSFNVRGVKPEVAANLSVAGLKTQKMVESQMPMAKNTIKGIISANVNIGGPGLNQPEIISGWKGTGSAEIKDAVFSTLDIGKQVRDGVIAKLPAPVRSKVKINDAVLARDGQYQVVSMKFSMGGGVLNLSELVGKAAPNAGLDLKGAGQVKLADYGLDLNLDIIDTYNLFNIQQYIGDKRYGGHSVIPAHLTNTLFSPKFDWGSTVAKLAQNAGKNMLMGQGKEALQKALGGKLPSGIGNLIGGGNGGGGDGDKKPSPADQAKSALKGFFKH